MNDISDQQLLRDYAKGRSEAAFRELVRRYVDLVYSAAFRIVGNKHAAEDVAQAVFLALAQNASRLTDHPVLSGWLHTTTRNLAANAVRADVRRQAREREAVAMNELLSSGSESSWDVLSPELDSALGALSDSDRDTILLRYFQKKSALEMASILGVSADAAQKRVSRAVERLREVFIHRGVTVAATAIAVALSANAVQAAPAGLAATITTTTLATSTAATSGAIKTIAMTTLQKTIVTAAVVLLAGVGAYGLRHTNHSRNQQQALNGPPPQMTISSKFAELTTADLKRFGIADTTPQTLETYREYQQLMRTLSGANIQFSEPMKVVTLSGRQAHIAVADKPAAQEDLAVDVLGDVSADKFSIYLSTVVRGGNPKNFDSASQTTVSDQGTMIAIAKALDGSDKRLVAFVTASVIDPVGNLIHTEKEIINNLHRK